MSRAKPAGVPAAIDGLCATVRWGRFFWGTDEEIGSRVRPPVHMIRLTEMRRIAPYKWLHPEEEVSLRFTSAYSMRRMREPRKR